MKYEIDLNTRIGQTQFEMGFDSSDDYSAMKECLASGMTLDEVCVAFAEKGKDFAFDDEQYDAYWDQKQAEQAFRQLFLENAA